MEAQTWYPKAEDLSLDDVPNSFRDVAEVIGLDACLALARVRGGTRIMVPIKPRPYHKINRYLSEKAVKALAAVCGGMVLGIPTLHTLTIRTRNRAIRNACDRGARSAEIAVHFRLSERRVCELLKETD
jgi:hypothetical protein